MTDDHGIAATGAVFLFSILRSKASVGVATQQAPPSSILYAHAMEWSATDDAVVDNAGEPAADAPAAAAQPPSANEAASISDVVARQYGADPRKWNRVINLDQAPYLDLLTVALMEYWQELEVRRRRVCACACFGRRGSSHSGLGLRISVAVLLELTELAKPVERPCLCCNTQWLRKVMHL